MAGSGGSPERGASAEAPLDPDLEMRISEAIALHVPHNRALGMRLVSASSGRVTLALPYDERLVGNPLTRVLHGGAITALLDATCGTAVFLKLREPIPVATLDLRIDYLRPATPDQEVHACAECFRATHHVAFVRCEAFHPDAPEDRVAVANGTFMVFREKRFGSRRNWV